MVATRLVEVTAKGTEWAYGGGSTQQPAAPPGGDAATSGAVGGRNARARETRSFTRRRTAGTAGGAYSPASSASSSPSPSGYDSPHSRSASPFSSASRGRGATPRSLSSPYSWRGEGGDDSDGNQSFLQKAAEAAYSRMSQAIASLYSSGSSGGYYDDTTNMNRTRSHSTMGAESTDQLSLSGRDGDDGGSLISSSRPVRRKSFTLAPGDLVMMFNNPYNTVRGRDRNSSKPASISAVRALLALVPVTAPTFEEGRSRGRLPTAEDPLNAGESTTISDKNDPSFVQMTPLMSNLSPAPGRISPLASPIGDSGVFRQESHGEMPPPLPQQPRLSRDDDLAVSPSETASQIAEGTIRAMRDLLCDEAVELRTSLRFWTERWERPIYSWLEAGPHGTPTLCHIANSLHFHFLNLYTLCF